MALPGYIRHSILQLSSTCPDFENAHLGIKLIACTNGYCALGILVRESIWMKGLA